MKCYLGLTSERIIKMETECYYYSLYYPYHESYQHVLPPNHLTDKLSLDVQNLIMATYTFSMTH